MEGFMRIAVLLVAMVLCVNASLASAQVTFPDEAPEQFRLAIIDVETTGLDPDHHEMIDLGAVYADIDGNEIGRFFVRIRPAFPDRADPGAVAVNGYEVRRWEALGAVSAEEAVRSFILFHERMTGGRTALFTAYNAWFDQAFMSRLLKAQGGSFRDLFFYHVLDLPSMAWSQGIVGLTGSHVARDLGIEDETRNPLEHTGETGAAFNLAVYRALLARTVSEANTTEKPVR
jgi:hypothetical protein